MHTIILIFAHYKNIFLQTKKLIDVHYDFHFCTLCFAHYKMARYKITFWKLYFEQKNYMWVTYITESIWSKLGLEHNQKNFRTTNLNNRTWPNLMTLINIHLPKTLTLPKKICWCVRLGQVHSPGSQAPTTGTPAQPH